MNSNDKRKVGCTKCGSYWNSVSGCNSRKKEIPKGYLGHCCCAGKEIKKVKVCPKVNANNTNKLRKDISA